MKLPGNSIGISDLLNWRECPMRFAHGMQRHEGHVPGETDWKNAYGSAIHDAIHAVEEGATDQDAVTQVWPTYAAHLLPDDLALLRDDLSKYRGDTPLGYELVTAEADVRVPLFQIDGEWFYFRFKLDALYRRTDDPTSFYHRDYKSSKWPKSQADVDRDPQMWAYNFGIHELYPECVSLLQSYEQLRFGNLLTSKNEVQRAQMKVWLIETIKAALADEDLEPKQNDWCAYCPLVIACPETTRAAKVWRMKLAVIAPQTKEGRKTRIKLGDEGDEMEALIRDDLPVIVQTRKHLEAAEKAIKEVIEQMPSEERERLGWRVSERKLSYLPPQALQALHERLGDSFYEAITMSKTAVEKIAGKSELDLARSLELRRVSSTSVVPTKGG